MLNVRLLEDKEPNSSLIDNDSRVLRRTAFLRSLVIAIKSFIIRSFSSVVVFRINMLEEDGFVIISI